MNLSSNDLEALKIICFTMSFFALCIVIVLIHIIKHASIEEENKINNIYEKSVKQETED